MPTFRPGELRWAGGVGVAVLALASAPYVAAWALTPPGHEYTWVLSSAFDVFSYLAKMQQAASGAWLLWVPHTTEAHPPALLFPQYVLLGKLAAVGGLPMAAAYHAGRVVAGALLLAAAYAFIATVAHEPAVRRAAFLFTAIGGGVSWILAFAGEVGIDATVPESNTFHTLMVNPHFPLATAALLAVACLVLWSAPRFSIGAMAAAGLLGAAAVAIQPFFVAIVACIGGMWLVLAVARQGWQAVPRQPRLALPMLAMVGTALAMWAQLQANPVLAGWITQNQTPSPSPLHFLAGYGLLAPLALVGAVRAWRAPEATGLASAGMLLCLAWVVALPIMFYAPTQFQRRLTEGAHVPVSVLAAAGLWWLAHHWGLRWWPLLRVAALALLAAGTLWMVALIVAGAARLGVPFYLPAPEAAALAWLGHNAAFGETVLASPTMGNVLPAYAPVRAYWGHAFETVDAQAKLPRVIRFFSQEASERERCQLLTAEAIQYVYEGQVERRDLGSASLAAQPGLSPAYQAPGVTIYRFTGCDVR